MANGHIKKMLTPLIIEERQVILLSAIRLTTDNKDKMYSAADVGK